MELNIQQWLFVALITSILFNKYKLAYIFLVLVVSGLVVQYVYHQHSNEIKEPEITCRKSTVSNPMGNLLPYDTNPSFKACNDPDDLRIDNLFLGFLRDQDDDINREKINPFLTLPVTNIEGMKTEFANFLIGDGLVNNCKHDGIDCEKYRDIRFSF